MTARQRNRCVFENCVYDKKQPLFSFPKDEFGALLWLHRIGKTHLFNDAIRPKYLKICGKHFSFEMFTEGGRRLQLGALPNCHLNELPVPHQLPQLPVPHQLPQLPIPDQLPQLPVPDQLPQLPIPDQLPQLPVPDQLPQLPILDRPPQPAVPDELPQLPIPDRLSQPSVPDQLPLSFQLPIPDQLPLSFQLPIPDQLQLSFQLPIPDQLPVSFQLPGIDQLPLSFQQPDPDQIQLSIQLPDPDPVNIEFRPEPENSNAVNLDELLEITYAELPAYVVVDVKFIEQDKEATECSLEEQEDPMRNETPQLFIKEQKRQYDKLVGPNLIVLSGEVQSYDSHNEFSAAPSPAPSDQTSNDKSLPSDWISYETDTTTARPPTNQVNYSLPIRNKVAPQTYTPTVQESKDKLTNKQSRQRVTSGVIKQTYFKDPSESPPTSSTRSYPAKIQSALSIKNVNTNTATVDNAISRANGVEKSTKKIVSFGEYGISVPHIALTASPPTNQVNYSLPIRNKVAPQTYTPTVQESKDKLTNKQSRQRVTSGVIKQTYFKDPSESPPTSSTRSYPAKIQSALSIKNVNTSTATVDHAISRANGVEKPIKKIVSFAEYGISVPHIVLTDAAVQTSYIPRHTRSIQAVAKTREAGVVTDFSYLRNAKPVNDAGTQYELYPTERLEFTEETDEKEISTDDYKIYKSGKHECLICGKICRNYKSLSQHIKDHAEKSTLCLFCGKIFTSDKRLQKHEQKRHLVVNNQNINFKPKKRNLHICPYRKCGQIYETLIDLYDHINIHIGEKPHKCSCGKSFPSYKKYQFHLLKLKCSKIGYEYPYSYLSNSKQGYTKDLHKFYTRQKVIVAKYKKRKFTLSKFQCKYCRKILKNHFAISIHMQKIHPSKVRYKINP